MPEEPDISVEDEQILNSLWDQVASGQRGAFATDVLTVRGSSLPLTPADHQSLSTVTDADLSDAIRFWRGVAPDPLKRLLEAKSDAAGGSDGAFTWEEGKHPRGEHGRFGAATHAMRAAHPYPAGPPPEMVPGMGRPDLLAQDPKLRAAKEAWDAHGAAYQRARIADLAHQLLHAPAPRPIPIPPADVPPGKRIKLAKVAVERAESASADVDTLGPGFARHAQAVAASHPEGEAALRAAREEAERRHAVAKAIAEAHVAALPPGVREKGKKYLDARLSSGGSFAGVFAVEEYHGPNPPGKGWTQAGVGPRGGKIWHRQATPDAAGATQSGDKAAAAGPEEELGKKVVSLFAKMGVPFDYANANVYDPGEIASGLKISPAEAKVALQFLAQSPEAAAAKRQQQAHREARQATQKAKEQASADQASAVQRSAVKETALPEGDWKPVKDAAGFTAQMDSNGIGDYTDFTVPPGVSAADLDRVGKALAAVKASGVRLPPKIVLGPPPKATGVAAGAKGESEYGAAGTQAEAALEHTMGAYAETLYLPPGALDAAAVAHGYAHGVLATPDPNHKLLHELGHFAQVQSGRSNYLKSESPQAAQLLRDHRKEIGQEVSEQAAKSPAELVAEVWAGTLLGQTYSPAVMGAYAAAGGPQVEAARGLRNKYRAVPAGDRLKHAGSPGGPVAEDTTGV